MSTPAITLSAPPGPPPEPAGASLAHGTVIAGKYRVERPIGRGGMGLVYVARHLELGIQVAVKVMASEAPSQVSAARFTREARAAALLKGEHVARVFDLGTTREGRPYIVMEYLEGCDLDEHLARNGALALPFAVEILLQICEALSEAHRHGIVHRDLKPSNVFLTQGQGAKPFAKLLDFGISKFLGSSSSHTSSGGPVGTPAYMSPEQLRGESLTVASDIWSLGVLLFELLTDKALFDASSFAELSVLVLTTPRPIRMTPDHPELPPLVDQILARCLALDPRERYASVDDLERDLLRLATFDPRASGIRRTPVVEAEPASADLHASWTSIPKPIVAKRRMFPAIAIALGIGGLVSLTVLSTRSDATMSPDDPTAAFAAPAPQDTSDPVTVTPAISVEMPSASQVTPTASVAVQPPSKKSPARAPLPPRTVRKPSAPPVVDEFGPRR